MHGPPLFLAAERHDLGRLVATRPNCAERRLGRVAARREGPVSGVQPSQGLATNMQCSVVRAALPGVPAQAAGPAKRRAGRLQAAQAEAATQRLTKDDLVAYLASGCKPRDQWR